MNTTKNFLSSEVTAALSARYCFFEHGETCYHRTDGVSKDDVIHLMFKWEFDRATNKASPILDMANWTYNSYEETSDSMACQEMVFCLGKDWNTGIVYYISAMWDEPTGSIDWWVSDKARYTD